MTDITLNLIEANRGWANINPYFTDALVGEWTAAEFTLEQCREWMNILSNEVASIEIHNVDFYKWMRDIKQATPEWALNYADFDELKKDFNFYSLHATDFETEYGDLGTEITTLDGEITTLTTEVGDLEAKGAARTPVEEKEFKKKKISLRSKTSIKAKKEARRTWLDGLGGFSLAGTAKPGVYTGTAGVPRAMIFTLPEEEKKTIIYANQADATLEDMVNDLIPAGSGPKTYTLEQWETQQRLFDNATRLQIEAFLNSQSSFFKDLGYINTTFDGAGGVKPISKSSPLLKPYTIDEIRLIMINIQGVADKATWVTERETKGLPSAVYTWPYFVNPTHYYNQVKP